MKDSGSELSYKSRETLVDVSLGIIQKNEFQTIKTTH